MLLVVAAELMCLCVTRCSSEQLLNVVTLLQALMPANTARSQPARLLLAHKMRHDTLNAGLLEECTRKGIRLEEIPFEDHHADYRSRSIKLYQGRWVGVA